MRRSVVIVGLLSCVGCATEPTDPADPADPAVPSTQATGELTPWIAQPPLPVGRANHCSTAVADWVVVIGGNTRIGDTWTKTADIHAARVHPDGTLGAWQLAGQTASPVTECTATSDGNQLYIIDGLYDDELHGRQIWTGVLDDLGHVGDLTSLGALPTIAISSEATARDGALLLMDTRLVDEGDTTVTMRTPLTGALAWATDDWAIGFRGQAQYAFAEAFVYVLGGYAGGTGNPVSTETFVAPVRADGAIGPVRPTTPLPVPVTFGEAVAVDDWLFVAGGRGQVLGAPGTANVYAARLDDAGDLASWRALAPLPMIRTNHELVVVGDHVVLTGGAGDGPGDTTVLTARVRFPAE
jgi:hypothetical protein